MNALRRSLEPFLTTECTLSRLLLYTSGLENRGFFWKAFNLLKAFKDTEGFSLDSSVQKWDKY